MRSAAALTAVLFSTSASADVTVDLIWTATTGAGVTGGTSIGAHPGDILTLSGFIDVGAEGLSGYAVSVAFDTALQDGLDLVNVSRVLPPNFENLVAFLPERESTGAQSGLVRGIGATDIAPPVVLGPDSFLFVEIQFVFNGGVVADVQSVLDDTDAFASDAGTIISALTLNGAQVILVCGDEVISLPETCDDGGTVPGDGCDANCQIEPGYICAGEPSVCSPCGDGVISGTETCDDSNLTPGDGCDASCQIEAGYSCNGGPSLCTEICPDGIVTASEGCDDGGTLPGDGCNEVCQVEPGYTCSGEPSECNLCGDGFISGSETCDDSNLIPGDGCDATCQIEAGYSCTGGPSVCNEICPDGIITASEGCDDGGTVLGDGCDDVCQVEPGYICSGEPSMCDECGDGIITGQETCDDQNLTPGDGCDASCQSESGYNCIGEPSVCSEICGDGVQTPGEECDDGNLVDDDGCSAICQIEFCGDGFQQPGEDCDDGNGASDDGCSASCAIETGFICFSEPSICVPICGDSIITPVEGCDDGNTIVGDGCDVSCQIEPGYSCIGVPSVCDLCGNGVIGASESCDDGGTLGGDGCDATCQIEPGYSCIGEPSICAQCGNGLVAGGETCDDGGSTAGDGCSDVCQVELGYFCGDEPSVCTQEYRLAFVTSGTRDALSSDIADYNAFVTAAANAVPELTALGTTWSAIGSTAAIDAHDNTGTHPSGAGVPIFLVDDSVLALDNADLWDGSIAVTLNVDENGTPLLVGGNSAKVWTGTASDGSGLIGSLLGDLSVRHGKLDQADVGWVDQSANDPSSQYRLYAVSGVLQAPMQLVPLVVPALSARAMAMLGGSMLIVALPMLRETARSIRD